MQVVLDVTAGPMAGQQRVFDEPDIFIVGRHTDCHYNLPKDPYLSRHHFMLEVSPPDIILRDLGSLNGTWVNGTRYGGRNADETPEQAKARQQQLARLSHGDQLKLGRTEMRLSVVTTSEDAKPEEAAAPAKSDPTRVVSPRAPDPAGAAASPPAHPGAGAASSPPAHPGAGAAASPPAHPGAGAAASPPAHPGAGAAASPPAHPGAGAAASPPAHPGAGAAASPPAYPGAGAAAAPPRPAAVQAPEAPRRPAAPPPAEDRAARDIVAAGKGRVDDDPGGIIDELLKKLFLRAAGKAGAAAEPMPVIAGYRVLEKLGAGGFGAVYRALQESTGREVALKTMLQTRQPTEQALALFQREIEVSKGLRHPHVIAVEDAGFCQGIHYFALELMDAGSVWDLQMRGMRAVPLAEAVPIMVQSLEGLAHAHSQGIIHRDLKPPNILLSRRGGTLQAKVSDFGLAKNFTRAGMTRNKITQMGSFCGSPPYVAPEHILNYRFLKPETDVFEMAATFYHMLTGRTVWALEGADFVNLILTGTITPIEQVNPAVPTRLAAVLNRALSRQPESRYAHAGDFLQALKRAV